MNLFADMGVQPATLQAGLVAATASTRHQRADVGDHRARLGDSRRRRRARRPSPARRATRAAAVAGVEVSVDGGATWHPAVGHASWSYMFTPATTGTVTIRSRATDDSVNTGAELRAGDRDRGRRRTGARAASGTQPATPRERRRTTTARPIDYGVKFRSDGRRLRSPASASTRARRTPARTPGTCGHAPARCSRGRRSPARPRPGWQQVSLDDADRDHREHHVRQLDLLVGRLLPGRPARTSRARRRQRRRCTRLQSGVDGPNGVYHEAPTERSRPTASTRATTGSTSCSRTAPTRRRPSITSRTPASGATGVAATTP